jgi:hypothetical protein
VFRIVVALLCWLTACGDQTQARDTVLSNGRPVEIGAKAQTAGDGISERVFVVAATNLDQRGASEVDRSEQSGSSACRPYLLFGSDSAAHGGSLQFIGITLVGALCALLGTFGLLLLFERSDRRRQFKGVLLAGCFLPLAWTFYGWGLLGHPGAPWGLCGWTVD